MTLQLVLLRQKTTDTLARRYSRLPDGSERMYEIEITPVLFIFETSNAMHPCADYSFTSSIHEHARLEASNSLDFPPRCFIV